MNLGYWTYSLVALAIAAAMLAVAACKGTGRWEVHGRGFGDEVSVGGSWDNDQGRITDSPGNANCDLKFSGPGGTTGTLTNVPVGQTFPIPPGTTSCVVTGVHPNGGSGGGGGGGSGSGGLFVNDETDLAFDVHGTRDHARARNAREAAPYEYFIAVLPLNPVVSQNEDGWGTLANVYAEFRYWTSQPMRQDELYDLVAPYVLTGIGNQPALVPGLECRLLARCAPNLNGLGGRLYVTDQTAAVESFTLILNNAVTATLTQGSLLYSGANGWKVVEVPLGVEEFNIAPDGNSSGNSFTLLMDTAGDIERGVEAYVATW